jgi:hypothetical protein
MAKDYSIECAPPYNSEADHSRAAQVLSDLLMKIGDEGKDASVVLLVDDTTHEDKSFDFEAYGNWFRSKGFDPNLVAQESQIVDECDRLFDIIDFDKLDQKLSAELKANKYISQLFIAAWCLMRLGRIESGILDQDLQAERIVNILPESFRSGEEDSLAIIRATPYAEAANLINYIYIPEA